MCSYSGMCLSLIHKEIRSDFRQKLFKAFYEYCLNERGNEGTRQLVKSSLVSKARTHEDCDILA